MIIENKILYQTIGNTYNNTRKADPYLTSRLMHHLNPGTNDCILDIGCGTGNYTIALTHKGLKLNGIDPSELMLKEAKLRNNEINWLLGTAENIPFKNNSFNGAFATLTIHHWTDFNKAFKELNRVLKNKTNLVIFTSTCEQMKGYWLNHYFPKMIEKSIAQMPSLKFIEDNLSSNGFEIVEKEKYFIQEDLEDCFLYAGKNRPQIYFNEEIRKGISSFSSLANIEEVYSGLANLKQDMENNNFEKIKKQYENNMGDYLFIHAQKQVNIRHS